MGQYGNTRIDIQGNLLLLAGDIIDSRLFRCSPTAPAPSRESSAPAPSYGESP